MIIVFLGIGIVILAFLGAEETIEKKWYFLGPFFA